MKSPLIFPITALCFIAASCEEEKSRIAKIRELEEEVSVLQLDNSMMSNELERLRPSAGGLTREDSTAIQEQMAELRKELARIPELEAALKASEKEAAALQAKLAPAVAPDGAEDASMEGVFDAGGKVKDRFSNSVLIIEGDGGVGSGFIIADDGKTYLYTAAHVFSGNAKLKITNAAGREFRKFGPLEAAEGADMVRMEILEEVEDSLQLVSPTVTLGIQTEIAALGNGGGTGVVSFERGAILGTSGESVEVDAGIISGNSGGPVLELASGRVVGLVTHLTIERDDIWSAGTRQAGARRFACRLNKEWTWKPLSIGAFLGEGKALAEYDELTRLCFAVAQLEPLTSGLRLDQQIQGQMPALEILTRNKDQPVVQAILKMNTELGAKRMKVSEADLKKRFRGMLAEMRALAVKSQAAFQPAGFSWFHRNRSEVSVKARENAVTALEGNIARLE